MKYDQFESKSNGIKKRKRLKKQKRDDRTWVERRRQEIIDNHSVFVAGASGFAEGFNISEKKHLPREVKLTPEWILDKMSLSRRADGKGVIYFYSDEENLHWIELALETLGITIIRDEIMVDCETTVYSFELLLDEIMEECPSLYQEFWKLHVKECLGE